MDKDVIIRVENLGKKVLAAPFSDPEVRFDVQHVVYAIENQQGRIYVGQTDAISERLLMHNTNRSAPPGFKVLGS